MERRRPGPRTAGIGAFLLFAATLVATGSAADTNPHSAIPHAGALGDTLGGNAEGLAAFTKEHALGRMVPLPADSARQERALRLKIKALTSQDTDAKRGAAGAQAKASEMLLTSPGGALDPKALDAVDVGEETEEWRCLAEAIYFEARGEEIEGQLAVAEVILNRVDSTQYPDTICDVVEQGANNEGRGCQFSYNCDGMENEITEPEAYDRIGKLAWLMLEGRPRMLTDEALYYHADYVSPSWASKFVRTATIGHHLFYRPEVQLSRN